MFDSIFDDIKNYFRSGNMISRLIIINAIVFLVIIFVKIGLLSTGANYEPYLDIFKKYISWNSDLMFNLKHPWVIVTHAFTHFGLFHFIFNMLFLYWFGRIVGDLIGDDKILPLYILGVIGGVLILSIFNLVTGANSIGFGASAAVWALILAAGFVSPDYSMHLILIGVVKLKFIILGLIVINLLAFSNMQNMGGQMAHLGGGIVGAFFVVALRNGTDLSIPINRTVDKISAFFDRSDIRRPKVKSPLKVSFKADERRVGAKHISDESYEDQSSSSKLDEILDKIKDKGIKSLSAEERQFLDQQSKKN